VEPRRREEFKDDYDAYLQEVLEPTRIEIRALLDTWRDRQYWSRHVEPGAVVPSPIHRSRVRIKRLESAEDKILRKPDDFPDGLNRASLERMNDAVGARAIVYFLSHLSIIDRELREHPRLEMRDQPVAYLSEELVHRLGLQGHTRRRKLSGYASLHYTMRLRDSSVPRDKRPWFEFQVRTLTEDVWGELEHILGYKPEKKTTFAVRQQFRLLARFLEAVDEHFNFIHDELGRLQTEVKEPEDDDVLNAENLPRSLREGDIACAQGDIDGLLKILASRGINRVGKLRTLVDPNALMTIRETWRTEAGEDADNFDVISTLVSAPGAQQTRDWVQITRVQLAIKRYSHEQKPRPEPPAENTGA
jgi:ppGpp synthetase/RelA/SpoT-type nucleotidyltranferase